MSRSFERSLKHLIGIEGEYSDLSFDTGGKTKFGITEKVAKEHGYQGEMKDLTVEFASSIYKKSYWDISKLSSVSNFSEYVAYEIFECSVNCGVSVAVKFFQRSLNAFNKSEELYSQIEVDGVLGDKTLETWEAFRKIRGRQADEVMLKALNGQQVSFYIRLAEKGENYKKTVYGWILKRT